MDLSKLIIRPARAEELFELRREILRVGRPIGSERFNGDDESTTRHVIAELAGEVVGCASIMRQPWKDESGQEPGWQLRGMAIATALQGRGVGGMILDEIDRIVRCEPFSNLLWCNARVPAARFYQNHDWQIASDEFIVEHFGPHVMMKKKIE